MAPVRNALPRRRSSVNFDIDLGGIRYQATVGFYNDGKLGEVFINGAKSGSNVESVARDGAILLSIALQYGVPVGVLRHSIARDVNGAPLTIVGCVIDAMSNEFEKG